MFSLFVGYAIAKSDRRLDPFQFNVCSWNLDGFDETTHGQKEEEGISRILYSDLSTCDTIVLPGITKEESVKNILSIMESKGMAGFESFTANSSKRSVTLYSRLDLNNKTDMSAEVKYPIQGSKCANPQNGTFDFSGSFFGELEFHDTVNKTVLFVVDFPTATEGSCSLREALATEICNKVKELPKDRDVVVSGTFGVASTKDEQYQSVLEGCGFKKGSSVTKKSVSNKAGTLIEDAYVLGGATKWLDIFSSVAVTDKVFSQQSVITYPTILYIHQPLSKRWFKFELSFSICMMTFTVGFFTWLMFFSRVKKEEEGEYEKIPGN